MIGATSWYGLTVLGLILFILALLVVAFASYGVLAVGLLMARKGTKPPRQIAGTKQAMVDAKKAKIVLRNRKVKTAVTELEKKKAVYILKAQKCEDAIARLKVKIR